MAADVGVGSYLTFWEKIPLFACVEETRGIDAG